MPARIYLIVIMILVALPVRAQQEESSGAQPAATGLVDTGDRMTAPTPVSGDGYSLAFASETPRSNYLRAGVSIGSAHDDNVLPASGQKIGDESYSILSSIALDQTRSRLHWTLNYSPGFTAYQHNTVHNGPDHNLKVSLEYRLSPHVTFSLNDAFQKTSNTLDMFVQDTTGTNVGAVQRPNDSIVPPVTAAIRNFGDAGVTYQFAPNAMIGARGTLSGLWYPERDQIPGLYDSITKAGELFYTLRLSERHHIGATYQYQNLVVLPSQSSTQTNGVLFFYTLSLQRSLLLSLFAGPEHASTHGGTLVPFHTLTPAIGGGLGWQGAHSSIATTFSRRTTEGGGLQVAVRASSIGASARWQMVRSMTARAGANYTVNDILDSSAGGKGGHTASQDVSIERVLRDNLGLEIGYTRVQQNYSRFFVTSNPYGNRNRVWVSLSYHFERPLGR